MEILDEKVYCRTCGKKTNHFILFQQRAQVRTDNIIYDYYINYSILICAGCDTITYADIHMYKQFDNQGNAKPKKTITIFPEEPKVALRVTTKMEIMYSQSIPRNIREIYDQLVTSYNKEHNLLCAIGLRTLIEAICNELNITKGFKYDNDGNPLTKDGKKESLEGKIFGLYEKQYITWYHTLILQRIREIGNAATHELVNPTSDEVYSAIDIVEKLLENVYVLKNHDLLKK